MAKMAIEQELVVRFPQDIPFRIALVGLGGTGSALALSVARLAYHARQHGHKMDVVFIDGDTVEPHNVGRQYFAPADIGRNKAEVMSEWINTDWGLDIVSVAENIDTGQTNLISSPGHISVIVGCVDNYLARLSIHKILSWTNGRKQKTWWIDCGNDRQNGQVLAGCTTRPLDEEDLAPELGLVHVLPAPSMQLPEIVKEPSDDAEKGTKELAGDADLSCAELTLLDEQGLHINQQMAVVAAQYLYQMVVLRELRTMATYVNLDPPTMRSTTITKTALAPFCKLNS